MKVDLAVVGQGAVTPAGIGIDALLNHKPTPIDTASLGQPEKLWPVLRIDQKDPAFARWQREPRLRRASAISFYLVEAAEQALAGVSAADRKETGLIVAFSAGCLTYSRRLFEGIVTQGQKTASPALFPETVFNSPVSHVASVLGLNGAAYSLVGDEAAWVAALKTASIWLKIGRVQRVLVLGAEEFDPIVLDAYRSARWLRRVHTDLGFLTSEGAAGILVRAASPNDERVITTATDGFIYRSKREAATAAEQLLAETDPAAPCFLTAQHNWLHAVERNSVKPHPAISSGDQPYLGEAFTASAAWNTLRALHQLRPKSENLLPIWGLNYQFGLLTLEARKNT
jgi:hypothetical protein